MGPILVIWLISILVLALQRDIGMSLLFFGLFVIMLYVATRQRSWVIIGFILFVVGAILAFYAFSHVRARIAIWLDPFPNDIYFSTPGSGQLVQGLFGMSNGGLIGTGWGEGFPWLTPFADSDFVYTSLAEVLGVTGVLCILFLFMLLVERGIKYSMLIKDEFGKLLSSGLSFLIALQVFVTIGGVTRLIPLSGMTVPFIARGGTALLANWVILSVLLVISNQARKQMLDLEYTGGVATQNE
jgi:cell division protein FtsW (lipid II flippase)